jgi:hypothetical protein
MPNKRKKGKKLVAGWLPEQEAEEFKSRAAERGITATDLLTLLIREEIRRSKATETNDKKGEQ